ncbi:MAG: hypothetical protein JWN00_4337 [Actinomycetia bacterium]|nr:hypothetical protein [Actinomycetes bacterium]
MTGQLHTTLSAQDRGGSVATRPEAAGPCSTTGWATGSPGLPERATIRRAGFWAAVVALAGAVGYILSVPLQVMSVLSPTQDSVLAFVSSLAIAPSFLVAVTALHYTVPPEKRFWTHVAVQFATVYATLACVNYVVQLATVLPAGYSWTFTDQAGTQGPLSVLNQTPHSLMWDIDGLAYVFLNLSTLFAARAFELHGPQRVIRRVFLANAAITPLFAVAYFWPHFSVPILLLGGIPWSVTVPACMVALILHFRGHPPNDTPPARRTRGARSTVIVGSYVSGKCGRPSIPLPAPIPEARGPGRGRVVGCFQGCGRHARVAWGVERRATPPVSGKSGLSALAPDHGWSHRRTGGA